MARIGLISCVSKKRSTASRAEELYDSALFSKSRDFVKQRCDRLLILSAKYGLVEPDQIIEPYEETLNTKSAPKRLEWASRVWHKLQSHVSPGDEITILAGERYREHLMPRLTAKRKRVDTWLARQFRQKNHILLDESVGLVVSDRCPLDPLVFTPKNEWKEKATLLLDTICPGRTTAQICSGQVIYLKNDPHALDLRVRRTNKKYRLERLDEMQRDIDIVYGIDGVKRVDAHLMSLVEIMQRVAHIIHMEDYAPSRLHERLCSVRNGELEEPLFVDQKMQ